MFRPTLRRLLFDPPRKPVFRPPPTENPHLLSNKFEAKRRWPPDMTQLSPGQQLHFEKKYKRRVALASDCPGWRQRVQLVQYLIIPAVVVYSVLVAQPDEDVIPFYGLRKEVYSWVGIDIGPEHPSKQRSRTIMQQAGKPQAGTETDK